MKNKRFLRRPPSSFSVVIKKIAVFVLIVLIVFGGFYVVFFSSFFKIDKIVLEKQGNAVPTSALSPFLDKLKGKNLLFVNLDSLKREIEQTFKNEVLMAKVQKSPPGSIIVKIEEYPAVLNIRVVTDTGTQKFIINKIGFTIAENIEQKDLPVMVIHSTKPIQAKSVIIPDRWLEPILNGFSRFQEIFGMKIISGEWKKVERELHITTEKNFVIWLDLTSDISDQFMKLKRALTKLDIYHEPLEYIDLRILGGDSEKVIYKRRK